MRYGNSMNVGWEDTAIENILQYFYSYKFTVHPLRKAEPAGRRGNNPSWNWNPSSFLVPLHFFFKSDAWLLPKWTSARGCFKTILQNKAKCRERTNSPLPCKIQFSPGSLPPPHKMHFRKGRSFQLETHMHACVVGSWDCCTKRDRVSVKCLKINSSFSVPAFSVRPKTRQKNLTIKKPLLSVSLIPVFEASFVLYLPTWNLCFFLSLKENKLYQTYLPHFWQNMIIFKGSFAT